MKNRGIALKLTLLILTSTMIIFGLIFGYNYTFSRRIIERNVEENAKNLTFTTVNKVETVLHTIEKIPENMAYFLENSSYRKNELLNLIRTVVKNNQSLKRLARSNPVHVCEMNLFRVYGNPDL